MLVLKDIYIFLGGLSSAGRAPALQAGGSGFESRRLHQTQSNLKKNTSEITYF